MNGPAGGRRLPCRCGRMLSCIQHGLRPLRFEVATEIQIEPDELRGLQYAKREAQGMAGLNDVPPLGLECAPHFLLDGRPRAMVCFDERMEPQPVGSFAEQFLEVLSKRFDDRHTLLEFHIQNPVVGIPAAIDGHVDTCAQQQLACLFVGLHCRRLDGVRDTFPFKPVRQQYLRLLFAYTFSAVPLLRQDQ